MNKILEGNKIIAEFMGKKVLHARYFDDDPCLLFKDDLGYTKTFYHSSWDSLMPVIIKISNLKIKYENENTYYNPYPVTFGMRNEEGLYMFRFHSWFLYSDEELIKAAWLAVTDFIPWYVNHISEAQCKHEPEEENFQPCDNCPHNEACEDFGCYIELDPDSAEEDNNPNDSRNI